MFNGFPFISYNEYFDEVYYSFRTGEINSKVSNVDVFLKFRLGLALGLLKIKTGLNPQWKPLTVPRR